jgi:Tfp pilus assembly protein PilW
MLTRIRSRARRVADGDAGVSLMELVVSMVLATALGAITLYFFVNVSNSSAATNDRTINTANARNTLGAWTSYLAVSDGTVAGNVTNRFEWLTATDMLFYAGLDNRANPNAAATAPTMMWLRLDAAGHLIEEQFASDAVAGSTWQVCRRLAESVSAGVSNQSTQAGGLRLFTASTATGTDLSGADLGTAPASGDGCQPLPETPPSASGSTDVLAVANLRTVNSVEIAFTIVDTLGKHPIEFDSIATVPALGASS